MTKNRPGKRRLRGYKRSPGRPYAVSGAWVLKQMPQRRRNR
jgi:hypothetical protein